MRCRPELFSALLVLLALVASATAADNDTLQDVWLSGFLAFTRTGLSQRRTAELMLGLINDNPDILPGYRFRIAWQDGRCNGDRVRELFLENLITNKYQMFAPGVPVELLNTDGIGTVSVEDASPFHQVWTSANLSGGPVGILGGACSGESMALNPVSNIAALPQISGSSTFAGLSDRSTFPNFWRTILPDTGCPAAWLSLAKVFGFSRISVVIGETQTWTSMAHVVVTASQEQGVALDGVPLEEQAPGFLGYQINAESEIMAAQAAEGLRRHRTRAAMVLLYDRGGRVLLCEAHKLGLDNFIFMFLGWLYEGWWRGDDTGCAPQDVTYMAWGFIAADKFYWRQDLDTSLSCSPGITAADFQTTWVQAHEGSAEHGYVPDLQGLMTADAVCMWALAIHQMLFVYNFTVQEMQKRTPATFNKVQDIFAATDFQGLSGNIRFQPGSAEPDGAIFLRHLQSFTDEMVDIASYGADGVLTFMGRSNLTFKLPGESFFAGPDGAHDLLERPASFKNCEGGTILNFASNTCEECSGSQEYVSSVDKCLCQTGYFEVSNGSCSHCQPGRFTKQIGSTSCELCPPGRFTDVGGQTSCARCGVGSFQNESGRTDCKSCPSAKPRTTAEGSESSDECACGQHQRTRADGSCQDCAATFVPVLRAGVASCECPKDYRFDQPQGICKKCEDHLVCPGGYAQTDDGVDSGLDRAVKVEEWYMTLQSDPFSVFRCINKKTCIGERAVATSDMCAEGRDVDSPRCALCQDGTFPSGLGRCKSCEESHLYIQIIKMVGTYLLQLAVTSRVYWNSARETGAATAVIGALISWLQRVQTTLFLPLSYPGYAADFVMLVKKATFSQIFTFLETGIECYSENGSHVVVYQQALSPLVVIANLAVMHLLLKCWRRGGLKADYVLNFVGLFFTGLFLVIANLSLSLFYTVRMPNGKNMVLALPELEFGSDEWRELLPVNVLAFMLYGLTPLSYIVYVVLTAPRRAPAEPKFLVRHDFCFGSTRPDRWWWILIELCYGLALILSQILVNGQSVTIQLYPTLLFTLAYFTLNFSMWPYLEWESNVANTTLKLALAVFLIMCTSFVDKSEAAQVDAEFYEVMFGIVSFSALGLGVVIALTLWIRCVVESCMVIDYREVGTWEAVWHMRDVALALAMIPEEDFARRLHDVTDRDCEELTAARKCIVNLIFGQQMSNRWTDQRLLASGTGAVWDHSKAVSRLLKDISSGHCAKSLERSANLRRLIAKIAASMYSQDNGKLSGVSVKSVQTSMQKAEGTGACMSHLRSAAMFEPKREGRLEKLRQLFGRLPDDLTMDMFEYMISEITNLDISQVDLGAVFRLVDADDSETLSLQEFKNMLHAWAPGELVCALEEEAECTEHVSDGIMLSYAAPADAEQDDVETKLDFERGHPSFDSSKELSAASFRIEQPPSSRTPTPLLAKRGAPLNGGDFV